MLQSPQSNKALLVVIDINLVPLPLPSRDTTSKQDIDFAVRSTLHLRQTPPRDSQTDERSTAPDVATFASDCIENG